MLLLYFWRVLLIIKNNIMKELFFMGGAGFMGIMSILFLVMVVWITYHMSKYLLAEVPCKEKTIGKIEEGKAIGLFALIFGILSQLLGAYHLFNLLTETDDIAPSILFRGIKVSMIVPIYGIIIYLITLILWLISKQLIDRKGFK